MTRCRTTVAPCLAPQVAPRLAPQVTPRLALLLAAAACSAAHADPPVAGPALRDAQIALAIAPSQLRAPYDVQILGADGENLPTYRLRDRFYVQGATDERYIIRIANPTPRRVEAVISVDGLDVIDGENGDLHKRGYIVPAFGETRIEGFRTSLADVATFRFSSVSGSYAGQKGKARNVGVIAVALFEEQAPLPDHEIVGELPAPRALPRPYRHDDRSDSRAQPPAAPPGAGPAGESSRAAPSAKRAEAPSSHDLSVHSPSADAPSTPSAGPATAGATSAPGRSAWDSASSELAPPAQPRVRRERPGLGTEFGEQRYSAVSYTQFVRAAGRPVAIAELRYNDAAGLIALGVPVQPLPDPDELDLRETAEPFPGDHFARAPR